MCVWYWSFHSQSHIVKTGKQTSTQGYLVHHLTWQNTCKTYKPNRKSFNRQPKQSSAVQTLKKKNHINYSSLFHISEWGENGQAKHRIRTWLSWRTAEQRWGWVWQHRWTAAQRLPDDLDEHRYTHRYHHHHHHHPSSSTHFEHEDEASQHQRIGCHLCNSTGHHWKLPGVPG